MNYHVSIKFILSHPIHFLSFGFGSGLAPKAPGTFGTLMAIPLYLLTAQLSLPLYTIICIAMCLLGVYFCDTTAKALKVHDHPGIVWDEMAGFFITMAGFAVSLETVLAGFVLFRFFDIKKPWPIQWVDRRISGGLGIMLDDMIAGIFAWCCLYGLTFIYEV